MKNKHAFWQRCLERGEQLLAPQPCSHTEAYRHELKYLISWADKAELTTRMSPSQTWTPRNEWRLFHPQPVF